MQLNTPINKKLLLRAAIAVLVIVGFFVVRSLGGKGDSEPSLAPLLSEVSVSPADAILGQDLLMSLSRLKSTHLDVSIFSDPAFRSLIDRSETIPPEPKGRRNPFAPIGVGGAPAR